MEKHVVKEGQPLEVTFLEVALETEHFEKIKRRVLLKDGIEFNDVVVRIDEKVRRFSFQDFCSRLGMGSDPMGVELSADGETAAIFKRSHSGDIESYFWECGQSLEDGYAGGKVYHTTVVE